MSLKMATKDGSRFLSGLGSHMHSGVNTNTGTGSAWKEAEVLFTGRIELDASEL